VLSSSLLSNIQHSLHSSSSSNTPVLTFITGNLETIKHQQPTCFLKWLFCLQSLGLSDPEFWKKHINSSVTAPDTTQDENVVEWLGDVLQKGALLLYCNVVLSQLKVGYIIIVGLVFRT